MQKPQQNIQPQVLLTGKMTNKDAQKTLRYEQSMKQQGFVRVHPWVKPADREAVLEYARQLREAKK